MIGDDDFLITILRNLLDTKYIHKIYFQYNYDFNMKISKLITNSLINNVSNKNTLKLIEAFKIFCRCGFYMFAKQISIKFDESEKMSLANHDLLSEILFISYEYEDIFSKCIHTCYTSLKNPFVETIELIISINSNLIHEKPLNIISKYHETYIEILKIIIDYGADINGINSQNQTIDNIIPHNDIVLHNDSLMMDCKKALLDAGYKNGK